MFVQPQTIAETVKQLIVSQYNALYRFKGIWPKIIKIVPSHNDSNWHLVCGVVDHIYMTVLKGSP